MKPSELIKEIIKMKDKKKIKKTLKVLSGKVNDNKKL